MSEEKKKILIVDDEDGNRYLLRLILTDYELYEADGGRQMWKVLETVKPDLILLDIMMPEVDGFQLAKQLSQSSLYSDIPFIFLSANTASEAVKLGFDIGGYDYVKKPVDDVELHARISAVLRKSENVKSLQERIVRDELTGLYNRRHFYEQLENSVSHMERQKGALAVSIVDIDHFKHVNDTYGHQAGDVVLQGFGQILQENLRSYDLLARYGGEEFVLMFLNTTRFDAHKVLERASNMLQEHEFGFDGQIIKITMSGGISDTLELGYVSGETLIKKADERLYTAKNTGRNKIVV